MTKNKKSSQFSFYRNYYVLFSLTVPVTIIGILFLKYFTIPLITAINSGSFFTANEIWSTVVVNLLVLGLVFYAWTLGIIESSVEFTEQTIKKIGILKSTTIEWSEIVNVYMVGPRITLKSNNKQMQVNVMYYREPDKLTKFISEKFKSGSER